MKVLITTDWYKPVVNGVVESVENLKRELLNMGIEVRILTLSDSYHSYIEGNVYYIGSVGVGAIYPQARMRIRWNRKMIKELIEWKPDIVHSQCEFSTFAPAKKIAYFSGAPLVHTYHTVYSDYTHYVLPIRKEGCPLDKVGNGAVKKFSEYILNRVNCVIAPSEKISDLLCEYDISSSVHVIPSGISLAKFSGDIKEEREEIRTKLGIPEDGFLLIYVGRLAKEKNLREIFEFLSRHEDKNQRMLIVGDGPYRAELEKKAAELNIQSRLIFTGMVDPKDVSKYYKAGDLFVNASTSETQGLTYIEAMACHLPVLCRKDDCLKDVIRQGENGFLYENEEEFCHILNALKADRNLCLNVGNEAYKTAKIKFCASAFALGCVKLYNECIKENQSA